MPGRIIEVGSRGAAEDVIAAIDANMGLPRIGTPEPGAVIDVGACQAWIDGPRTTRPPPGVTATWAEPHRHPTQPGRWSVYVDDERLAGLLGRTIAGVGPITEAHAVERTPDWVRQS